MPLIEYAIEQQIDDYTLPTDPCLFDSVNATWIWSQLTLNSNIEEAVIEDIKEAPCQVWIDPMMTRFLYQRNEEYLIDYDYWFGVNDTCDTENVENNIHDIVAMPCDEKCTVEFETSMPFLPTEFSEI